MNQFLRTLESVSLIAAAIAFAFAILSATVVYRGNVFWYYSTAYVVAWRMAMLGVLCEIALRLSPAPPHRVNQDEGGSTQ